VIDFGVARAVERIQITVTHGAVGTPAYAGPDIPGPPDIRGSPDIPGPPDIPGSPASPGPGIPGAGSVASPAGSRAQLVHSTGGRRGREPQMKRASQADPFAALELLAEPDLTDDDVRSAWRRIAAATHPDRGDGGDPARFAEAAAAYTTLRTQFGRGEALADLAGTRHRRSRWTPPRWPGALPRPTSRPRPGTQRRRRPGARLALGRFWSRVRRGRPARLALRLGAASAVSVGVVLVAGAQPATPALITGALTWLCLTARHDLADPDTHPGNLKEPDPAA